MKTQHNDSDTQWFSYWIGAAQAFGVACRFGDGTVEFGDGAYEAFDALTLKEYRRFEQSVCNAIRRGRTNGRVCGIMWRSINYTGNVPPGEYTFCN